MPDVVKNRTASRNPRIIGQQTIFGAIEGYEKHYFLGGSVNWANIRGVLRNNIPELHIHEEGSYTAPRNLGPPVNTPGNELDPAVSLGGFGLHYAGVADDGAGYDLLYTTSREVFTRTDRYRASLDWAALWAMVWPYLLATLIARSISSGMLPCQWRGKVVTFRKTSICGSSLGSYIRLSIC